MTEHEPATIFFNCTSRRWTYAVLVLWAYLLGYSIQQFGNDIWLTRLMWYGFVAAVAFVVWSLICLGRETWLKLTIDDAPIGEQNLFVCDDRDPEDPRLI